MANAVTGGLAFNGLSGNAWFQSLTYSAYGHEDFGRTLRASRIVRIVRNYDRVRWRFHRRLRHQQVTQILDTCGLLGLSAGRPSTEQSQDKHRRQLPPPAAGRCPINQRTKPAAKQVPRDQTARHVKCWSEEIRQFNVGHQSDHQGRGQHNSRTAVMIDPANLATDRLAGTY